MYTYIFCLVLSLTYTNGQGPVVPPGLRPLVGPPGEIKKKKNTKLSLHRVKSACKNELKTIDMNDIFGDLCKNISTNDHFEKRTPPKKRPIIRSSKTKSPSKSPCQNRTRRLLFQQCQGQSGTFVTTDSVVFGTCYFNNTYSPVQGRVDIRQDLQMNPPSIEMRVQAWGLPQSTMSDAEHAMHVHQWGDTTRNCYNAGPHFDSDAFSVHGGPASMDRTVRHDGDLGNLRQTNDGIIDTGFNVQNMMLVGDASIMGRSIVMHEGRDDLGRGNTPVSLQTGNSGAPIACCVVGLSDSTNWNNPLLINGQFVNRGGMTPLNPNLNILG